MGQRVIDTVLKLSGEADYRNALKNCNSELKLLKSDLEVVNSNFRDNANSMEALTAKGEALQKMYDAQAKKIATLAGAQEYAEKLRDAELETVEKLEAEYTEAKKALDAYGKEMDKNSDQYKAAEKRVNDLKDAYVDHKAKLDAASRSVESYHSQYNKAKVELNKFDDQLKENKALMAEAESSADGCARSIDKYGKKVKEAAQELDDAEDEVRDFNDALDDVETDGLSFGDVLGANLISEAAGRILDSLGQVVEETREYRQVMASLKQSSEDAGYAADETADLYNKLFGVLGENQAAATTTANLQALNLEQDALMDLTEGVIGAWAKYGDSIPIDGLAEAVNHTAKLGEVQGTLADVLEWAGITTDEFNEQLAACADTTERADLIARMFAEQGLDKLGKGWQENNKTLVEHNNATAHWQEQLARLGEKVEPFVNFLTEAGAKALGIINDLLDQIGETTGGDLETNVDNFFRVMEAGMQGASLASDGLTWDYAHLADETVALTDDIVWLGAEVDETADAVSDFGDQVEDTADDVSDSSGDMTKALAAASDDIMASYAEIRDAARDSIDSQIGLFDDLSGKCELTAQDMIDALASQRKAFEDYADNITTAMERGIDIGLVQKLSDGSKESMQQLAVLVSMSEEEIAELNENFRAVENAKDSLSEGMAAVKQEFLDQLVALGALTKEEAFRLGQYIVDGMIGGVEDKKGAYSETMTSLANAGQDAYREANAQHSPSRRYKEFAQNDVDGLIGGYEERKEKFEQTAADVADVGYQSILRSRQSVVASVSAMSQASTHGQGGQSEEILLQILEATKQGRVIVLDSGAVVGGTLGAIDSGMGSNKILSDRGVM